jgi:hypothetical protein
MAANEYREPGWIETTYVDSPAKRACVAAVRKLRGRAGGGTTRQAIQAALLVLFAPMTDDQLGALTLHLCGRAFDVRPRLDRPEVAAYLAEEARKRGGKFLDREGGLLRYHWQAKRGS